MLTIKENWSLEKELASLNASPHVAPQYPPAMEDITVNTLPAKKITYRQPYENTQREAQETIIMQGTTAFIFDFWIPDPEFEAVIQSFRFLPPPPSPLPEGP
jgi:hypothetical protein